MNHDEYRAIARNVLKLAFAFDPRVNPGSQDSLTERISAWALVLNGQVWPTEAEAAVVEHYREPKSFPITPGDVVAYCQSQPVWSSAEHVIDWLSRVGVQNPYSGIIEAYSGISEPVIEIPAHIGRAGEKAYLIEELSRWVSANRDDLVAAILERRYVPWFQGGAA